MLFGFSGLGIALRLKSSKDFCSLDFGLPNSCSTTSRDFMEL